MQVLQKTEIANSILLEYLGELSHAGDKINYFCKKYRTTFKLFEKKNMQGKRENFSHWDDYMEWKAYSNVFHDLSEKIKDIRRGHFKVA